MKKNTFFNTAAMFALALGLTSACKNADIDHPDYEYTSGYFPYQYPIRTLILGEDIYDNSNDLAGKFLISVAMGGVYENTKDRNFEVAVDETLARNVKFAGGSDTIRVLPKAYYTLSSANSIVIPKGKYNGALEVQLSEAFFADPKAIKLNYVLPVRIVGSNDVDTILAGNSNLVTPDRRIATNWNVLPKDFTMFAIKYINEFHGNYFHQGESLVKDSTGAVVERKTYKAQYVEQNPVALLTTSGRHQVSWSVFLNSTLVTGQVPLLLTFNGNAATITSNAPNITVTGTATFKKGAYEWGNKSRNGIELKYTVVSGKRTYEATDILVSRDRAVVMELFSPQVYGNL